MRPQEYLVLPNSAVRETGVEVVRALDGGGQEISVTKTRAGRHFIDLNPDTLDIVRHYARTTQRRTTMTWSFPAVVANGRASVTGANAASDEPAKRPGLW